MSLKCLTGGAGLNAGQTWGGEMLKDVLISSTLEVSALWLNTT